MQLDLIGKINEKKLSYNNTLLPLYEAIVNSIQAIEEGSATKYGLIEIKLVRNQQTSIDNKEGKIIEFHIKDDGIGFNSKNYESFNYAHSTYKARKGGKGIGRFIWLRAFQAVDVESRYKEESEWYLRKFKFLPTKKGIEKHSNISTNGTAKRYTTVKLKGLKEDYQRWCNQDPEEIAMKIIEHCFVYFLQPNCPIITLVDGKKKIVVNDLIKLFTKGKVKKINIKIRDLKFKANIIKLYDSGLDNKVHFCAHTREVQNEKLNSLIPELDTMLVDDEGKQFSIAVYVTSDYFDEKVNEERTNIALHKSNSDMSFPNEATKEEVLTEVADLVNKEFERQIESISEVRFVKMREFIYDNPQYKQLLKYRPRQLKRVNTNLSRDKMEIEVFKIRQDLELEVKTEVNEVLNYLEKTDKAEYEEKHSQVFQKVIEVGSSKLSEYIIHRKLILEILEKHIKPNEEGKFSKEDTVHKLIFPLRKISEDISYEDHNLWIIDEKLAYHKYLASDKRFKAIKPTKADSNDRPDVLIFNRPFAFVNDEKPYESIVLIEFKRPMRDDYSDRENPILQINSYARQIIDGEVKDKNKREFDLRQNTPIYSYIVCDLTKNLKSFAKDAGYKLLPDGGGYFSFNDNYNMYIEIISFDKLIRDSKERNKILFDKLNM